jgi:hypothetical protein
MRGTFARRRTVRPRRRRLAAEQLLEPQQRAREGVRLGGRKILEKRRELLADRTPRRGQRHHTIGGERELLATAVRGGAEPLDEAGLLERGEQLGDRRGRDGGATGELRADHLALGDRLECQELTRRERRLVRGQQPLDPARGERRHATERVGRLFTTLVRMRWHDDS